MTRPSPAMESETAPPAAESELSTLSTSSTLWTAINLFLFFHLFCLFVAVVGNSPASRLLTLLHRAPGPYPYLRLTFTDLNYKYDYMQGDANDRGWVLEANLTLPDKSTKTVRIPEARSLLGLRNARYNNLLNMMGRADEAGQGVLAKSISTSLLKQHGAERVVLRLRAHAMLEESGVREGRDPLDTSTFETVYESELVLTAHGRLVFTRISARAHTAPTAGASRVD